VDRHDSTHHISHQFDEELADIRRRVLIMGGMVEQQLDDAVRAMCEGDADLARTVASSDYKINAIEVQIDEESTQIIARRQPAASDLRFIMAVVKTITDLERIGDEAERVGRMALHMMEVASEAAPRSAFADIEHIGQHVKRMLHDALDALARLDVDLAVSVAREDIKVDGEYEAIMRQCMTYMMQDPRTIPLVLDIMWSARALERIGDRSRNICEYVIYLVRGKDVRHTSLDRMAEEARGDRS